MLAGLEVVRALNDARIETDAALDVICWTNEEGVRFGPPLAGSQAFAGRLDVATLHAAPTTDGTTVGEDLQRTGFLGTELPGSRPLNCFIEAHIEQGPILEAQAKTIGVVTHIIGIRWSIVTLTGVDSHAGMRGIAEQRGLAIEIARSINIAPLGFAQPLIDIVRNTANELGYSNIDMLSGAGHDAMNVARVVPTAMIRALQRRAEPQRGRERHTGGSGRGSTHADARPTRACWAPGRFPLRHNGRLRARNPGSNSSHGPRHRGTRARGARSPHSARRPF